MADAPRPQPDRLEQLERQVNQLRAALALVGVKACGTCGKFFRATEPRNLFDCGELVCGRCVFEWWPGRSPELSVARRRAIEVQLQRWLVSYQGAEVIRQASKLPEPGQLALKMVVGCQECASTGQAPNHKPCSHCDGRGTVWVVVRAENLRM